MKLPNFFGAADDSSATLDAISRSQAVIEFKPDGTILTANQNFLSTLGYSLDEIKGQHHGMFVEPAYRNSNDYREFWQKLQRGEFQAAEFKRIANPHHRVVNRYPHARPERVGGKDRAGVVRDGEFGQADHDPVFKMDATR